MKIVHYGAYIDPWKVKSLRASWILKKKKKKDHFWKAAFQTDKSLV
jgi:hypothetical protein